MAWQLTRSIRRDLQTRRRQFVTTGPFGANSAIPITCQSVFRRYAVEHWHGSTQSTMTCATITDDDAERFADIVIRPGDIIFADVAMSIAGVSSLRRTEASDWLCGTD